LKEVNSLFLTKKFKDEQKEDILTQQKNISASIVEIKKKIDSLQIQISEKENQINSLNSILSSISTENFSPIATQIEDISRKIEDVDKQIESIGQEISTLKEKRSQLLSIKEQFDTNQTLLTNLTPQLENNIKLQFVFGKNGVSNSFVEETISELQDLSNQYLWQIDPTKSITFKTKTDTGKETFDILVADREHVRVYERFSGGEKTTINLSIRLALSTILNKRCEKKIKFIILDEVFGSLCDHNRTLVTQFINYLRSMFVQILIISHTDLKDQFENLIQVNRYEDYSEVQLLR
jgi:DNA repair exonuclease SbcCD ATPase subunit